MTVLEWLGSGTRYTFDEKTFERIALERGVTPTDDVFDDTKVTQQQRDLMDADVIYTAVLRGPSNTASLSQSHNGYQKTIGQESDTDWKEKLKYALAIYDKYDDDKAEIIRGMQRKIKVIPIKDVFKL